jgi:tight adherence protein C
MTAVIIVFAGLGAAVAALAALLMPDRPTLLVSVGRLDAGRAGRTPAPTAAPLVRTLAGRQEGLGRLAARWGLDRGRIGRALVGRVNDQAADLAVTERSGELQLGRKMLTGLCGFCLLPTAAIAMYAVGVRQPALSVLVGAPALGVAFYFVPDLALRREAEERRRDFRRALSCYLDLVAMSLAGGRGAPQALPEAAALSDGWAYRLIGDALAEARLAGRSSWRGLGELGERIGVPELCELAGSLALVGDHGARVRDTLTARAATLRRRALTDAEGQASQADQSMRIAQVLLAFGFLILIAYPALAAVLAL